MNFNKNRLFKYLYRLHLYGGLFCAVYLFIVGLSTLNFQHHFLPEKETDTLSYTQHIPFNSALEADTLARYITAQLGITGNLPRWDFKEDSTGSLQYKIHRPARMYEVTLNRNNDLVKIHEIHYSTGRILRALHVGSVTNLDDPLLRIWAYYAQVSAIFAIIAVGTAIYFWFKKSVKNRSQWFLILCSGIFSLIYTLYIWLIG